MSNHDTVKPTLSVTAGIKRSGSVADDMTPTTPRPTTRFSDQTPRELACEDSSSNTPTLKHFPTAQGQRPLPDEPFAPSKMPETTAESGSRLSREDSRHSIHSLHSNDSQDVEMGDDDDEGQDGEDRSDNESATSDSQRPSKKKKKGQRFYCTEYPPCQLSFTRSEHLARHIRKHTGERPFQCHCSRRFSRLDNLRQHAQTVHVNEEIPGDSLAATGTRFQRQVRTDRIRPPNTRPRASTVSSHGGHSRGHSRNLSASSITSSTSTMSITEDSRPRPAPLAISQDSAARTRLSLETFNPAIGAAATQYGLFQQSPGGYSTPTSTTFSNGPTSPRFSSDMSSPTSTISRSSFYNGSRTPSRRLSVPSGSGAYPPSSHGPTYPPSYYSPMSNTNTIMASPNPSLSSNARRDSDADLDWRRRTWHPGTQSNFIPRPATSGLSYHQTPDDAAPAMSSQPAASQVTRLPGIESFDHAPPPPVAAPRHPMSPPQLDHTGRPLSYPSADAASTQDDRRPSSGWETGLHQNLTRLDIGGSTTPRAPWHGHSRSLSSARPLTAPHSGYAQQYGHPMAQPPLQAPADFRSGYIEPMTGKRDRADKRQAWYGGPVAPPQGSQPIMIAQRTSPDSNSSDGVPTPSTSHGREMYPAIRHANGMIEMQPPGSAMSDEHQQMMQAHYNQSKPEPVRADSGYNAYAPAFGQMPPAYLMQSGHDIQAHQGYSQTSSHPGNDMGRLEALVAVATRETRAVEHRS